MAELAKSVHDRQWFIVGRWQAYEGESRANLLRIIAIGVFYIIQLIHFYGLFSADTSQAYTDALAFHQAATALAVAGSLMSLAILLCLRRRVFPEYLKYISAIGDVILVTSLAAIGSGPLSPLVSVYFIVIAMAGLRFSLRLVWCSTLGAMVGYYVLVGIKDDSWFDPNHFVAPVEQIMTLVCLALTGIITGQVIRRVRAALPMTIRNELRLLPQRQANRRSHERGSGSIFWTATARSTGCLSVLRAAVPTDATLCWLCNWDLTEAIVTAEIVGRPPRHLKPTGTRDGLIAGVASLGVVTLGVFVIAPGIGVLMAVVFVVAAFAVAISLQSEGPTTAIARSPKAPPIVQAYASPTTATPVQPTNIAVEVLKVLGIIILLGIASIIAFFTFCVICVMAIANS